MSPGSRRPYWPRPAACSMLDLTCSRPGCSEVLRGAPAGHHALHERAIGFVSQAMWPWGPPRPPSPTFSTAADRRSGRTSWRMAHRALVENHPASDFVSMHQWPRYPVTGSSQRIEGRLGTVWNVPLPPACRRRAYRRLPHRRRPVEPVHPGPGLVSAGFDSLQGDPLGGLTLELSDIEVLTRRRSSGRPRGVGGGWSVRSRICRQRTVRRHGAADLGRCFNLPSMSAFRRPGSAPIPLHRLHPRYSAWSSLLSASVAGGQPPSNSIARSPHHRGAVQPGGAGVRLWRSAHCGMGLGGPNKASITGVDADRRQIERAEARVRGHSRPELSSHACPFSSPRSKPAA